MLLSIWLKIIIKAIYKKSFELEHTITIDIYSDTICPWCYIGKRKLQSAINCFPNYQFNISWRPYQLNPDMPFEGVDRQQYLSKKFGGSKNALKIYNAINETGKKIDIFFQFDKIKRTPNTLASHKLLALGHRNGKQNSIIESIFYSYFIKGKDIGQLKELIIIAKQNNLDEQETIHYLDSNQDNANLLEEEIQARRMGIKGVPCFIINKEYVLFGVQEKNSFINLFDKLI